MYITVYHTAASIKQSTYCNAFNNTLYFKNNRNTLKMGPMFNANVVGLGEKDTV